MDWYIFRLFLKILMFTVESFVAFTVGNGGCARFIKEVANPACHACDFGVCLDEEKGDNELEFVNGMKLDRGYASPYFITDKENKTCRRPLLIVAEDVEMDDVIEFLILDKTCLATQVVTGGFDVKLMPQVLGSCKEACFILILCGLSLAVIMGYNIKGGLYVILGCGKSEDIKKRCEELRLQLGSTKESPRCRGFGQDRDKKLGGASGVNLHKMNITLDNARIAVKAALEEGIVPGGGVALLHASKVLSICSNLKTLISKLVLRFYRMLLRRLCSQLLSAAGFDGSIVVRKQLVQDNLVYENVFFMTRLAVVFTDISLDKAIEFNGLCHHQGRS
ncbi:hypothetical protein WN943_026738 [Citrus x changshan-huyou]